MRFIVIILLVAVLTGCSAFAGCSKQMDQRIRESTNLGGDDLIKARDKGMEGALIANLNADPALQWYYKQGHFTGSVSHAVITLTGKLRTQELVDQAVEMAKAVKDVKEVINEIVVDPTIEEPPFDW